ncbi:MAG: tagatose 1,6-diphosphate aldolase, partial [Acidobacteria bacterium]|nr:tagatose 1,6-diphosphate aldolase [Acidobacteriota bacterium]
MVKITAGKVERMKAVTGSNGVISAAAMDQRGSLQKAIAKERGVPEDQVTAEMMAEFKTAVTRILTPYASAILLDPEYGLEALRKRAPNAGVLLAYEQTGYEQTEPGRIPRLVSDWTVKKALEAGAHCIKLLIYYSPFETERAKAIKHAFVARIGAECEHYETPFFLEFVGYDPEGGNEKGIEYAKRKPEIVAGSMEEFSKPEYYVDILKVEVPINLQFVEGARCNKDGKVAYSKKEALEHFCRAAET